MEKTFHCNFSSLAKKSNQIAQKLLFCLPSFHLFNPQTSLLSFYTCICTWFNVFLLKLRRGSSLPKLLTYCYHDAVNKSLMISPSYKNTLLCSCCSSAQFSLETYQINLNCFNWYPNSLSINFPLLFSSLLIQTHYFVTYLCNICLRAWM